MDSKYSIFRKFGRKSDEQQYDFPTKRKAQNLCEFNAKRSLVNISERKEPTHDQKIKKNVQHNRRALPIYKCRNRILKEISESDTILLMGETGTGKTTQIPQFLVDSGYTINGMIGVTQPRRVAAITIAKRVAQEMNCNVGELVGYTVRFEDCTSLQTRIRFLTDGSLLREALSDRLLKKYTVLMLDEAHERTISTDVLFGIVKEAQSQRRLRNMVPLKIIITSATMDIDHFGKYFKVRGLYLEGRTYPVRALHAKVPQTDYMNAALVTLFQIHKSTPLNHDVLVFLTGQDEIETMAKQIRQIDKVQRFGGSDVKVFSLYAQLPQAKQMECFQTLPETVRKIVLATNIAETSVTIPGIRCVIDCGYVKQKIHNPNCGLDILRAMRISQAQAWQRCGRAGRESSGVCYRTYTQAEMNSFNIMSIPEILRCNICSTILQLLSLGIDCQQFDFLDAPSEESVNIAYRTLESLGAVKTINIPKITEMGVSMASYPLDPKYSKLLLAAPKFGCMSEMLSLVALLSSENICINTVEKCEVAALAQSKFYSKHGDHLTLLNIFNAFLKTQNPKLWCHDNFLNIRNLNYAREVRDQLFIISERLSLTINSCGEKLDAVRKCLLTGLFENIAELQQEKIYLTLSGRQKAKIHPSSVLHGKYNPNYIVFSEIVMTERSFLRIVTEISPEWINEIVPFHNFNRIKKKQYF